MNLRQIIFIIVARWKIALAVAIFTVAAALIGSMLVPKQYVAEAVVLVDVKSPDPVAAMLAPTGILPGTLGTQVDIINSNRVALKVVKMIGGDKNESLKQRWLASTNGRGNFEDWLVLQLQKRLKVSPSNTSSAISISYRATNPTFAAAVANGYAQAFIEAAVELRVEPARQYARWFGDQAKLLRENVEKAQNQLSKFQEETGIVGLEDADYELHKLNVLAINLTTAQAEIRDAQSKRRTADDLPEVTANATVSKLRLAVGELEAKLKESALNFGTKHPQYIRMEAELAELKNRLQSETRLVASGFSATSVAGKARENDLKAALDEQKAKIFERKKQRDQIAVLVRDLEIAKKAYDAVTNRYTQASLESLATQTNVSILTPATDVMEPVFPRPLEETLLIAFGLAILFGGAAAFVVEGFDHRVRSPHDLADMLEIPVLGTIQSAKESRSLLSWRRPAALLK